MTQPPPIEPPAAGPPPPPPPDPAGRAPVGPQPGAPRRRAGLIAAIVGAVVVVAAIVVVLVLVVGGHKGSGQATAGSPLPASASPSSSAKPSAGVSYTDPEGRWSAVFGGKPTYHDTTQSTPQGDVPYKYAEYTGFDVDQLVGVLLLPAGSTYDLQKGLDGIASTLNGTVAASHTDTFQGHDSIEGVISVPSGSFFKARVVHVGDVVYVFGTVGPVNPPTDYDSFVSSVQLTPH